MHISVAWHLTSLNVSCNLLALENTVDPILSGYLHAEISLVNYCFRLVNDASTEYCIIWIIQVNYIKGDFSIRALYIVPKDTGNVIFPKTCILFPPKPNRGLSTGGREFLLSFI